METKEYTYEDVLYVMERYNRLYQLDTKAAVQQFWLMFVGDAILGNRDRHEANWGFTVDDCGAAKIAPIFDNGSSLFPDVDLFDWKHEEFIRDRVYKIQGSQLRKWREGITDRPMRTNYWEVLHDFSTNIDLEHALSIAKSLDVVSMINNSVTGVPEPYATWFSVIIYCRYHCLIMERDLTDVYKEAMSIYDN